VFFHFRAKINKKEINQSLKTNLIERLLFGNLVFGALKILIYICIVDEYLTK